MTNEIKMPKEAGAKKPKSEKKKRVAASLDKKKSRSGWLFVLPFIIGFVIIYFPMLFNSLKLSFQTQIAVQNGAAVYGWAGMGGFENYYKALFENADFVQTLVLGLQEMIFDIPAIIIFSLFMAVLLNQKMAGRALFRAIFFIPVIISTGIMEQINMPVNSGGIDMGEGESTADQMVEAMDIEALFAGMKIGTELLELVAGWVNNILNIVNRSGVQMLVFLAGLQSISPAIYESCQIDGATAWETFWKITFPMISPMILVNAVYTVIDSFTTSKNTVMTYIDGIYEGAGSASGTLIATAMSWIYFLIVILIVAVIAAICSAFVFYQRRND